MGILRRGKFKLNIVSYSRNCQLSGLKSQIKHGQDPPEESQQIPRILMREKVMESRLK